MKKIYQQLAIALIGMGMMIVIQSRLGRFGVVVNLCMGVAIAQRLFVVGGMNGQVSQLGRITRLPQRGSGRYGEVPGKD